MELRLQTTRTTRDIDLSWRGKLKAASQKDVVTALRETLQGAAGEDLNDHFVFLIGEPLRDLDLVDMVLLIKLGLDEVRTREAVAATFERRKTHDLPQALTPPPADWARLYGVLAKECHVSESMEQAFRVLYTLAARLAGKG